VALADTVGAAPDDREFSPKVPQAQLISNATLVKLVTSFLISFPLAALLKRIPDSRPDLKNLFAIRYDIQQPLSHV
jgi:lysophospholipid acyltransferase